MSESKIILATRTKLLNRRVIVFEYEDGSVAILTKRLINKADAEGVERWFFGHKFSGAAGSVVISRMGIYILISSIRLQRETLGMALQTLNHHLVHSSKELERRKNATN